VLASSRLIISYHDAWVREFVHLLLPILVLKVKWLFSYIEI